MVIEAALDELVHGVRYRAHQDGQSVLVTVLDPVVGAQIELRTAVIRDVGVARSAEHRCLLPVLGVATTSDGTLIVEADPDGPTVREFAAQRSEGRDGLDGDTASTLVGHVCSALDALHAVTVHGLVTADTVFVSQRGRVLVSAAGLGPTLPRLRGLQRMRAAGALPNVAPEQVLDPPQLTPATDVYGVATLFIELVTGLGLSRAGASLRDLGLTGPAGLVAVLERATQPTAAARYPDVTTFKRELAAAIVHDPVEIDRELTRPTGTAPAVSGRASAMPPPPPPRPPPPAATAAARPVAAGDHLAPAFEPPPAGAYPYPWPPPWPVPHRKPPPKPLDPRMVARLDRATKLITRSRADDAEHFTELIDESSAKMAQTDLEAASSGLGLRLEGIEDAQERLATLDGEASPEGLDQAGRPVGPSQSGTFYGSFAPREGPPTPSGTALEVQTPRGRVRVGSDSSAVSDLRPDYVVLQGGAVLGPYSLFELTKRVTEGHVELDDTLRHQPSGQQLLVRDITVLVAAAAKRPREAPWLTAAPRVAAPRVRGPQAITPQLRPRGAATSMWVIAVVIMMLAGLAATAWWMQDRL